MSWSICLSLLTAIILSCSSEPTGNPLVEVWKSEEWGDLPSDPSDIISIMFHRFANDEKGLSISRFEQLVNCSLGISECPELNSDSESSFSYLTNCSLNSALSYEQCEALHKCTKGKDLLSLVPSFNLSTNSWITETELRSLLPSILYQTQSQLCKRDQEILDNPVKPKKPSNFEVWGYGILFVTLISACSLAGVSVLPLMEREFYQKLLTVLIGLAVGSLAASAVFHLIPQAYGLTETSDHHEYLNLSLMILFGVWAFFMIERILKIIFTVQKFRSEKLRNSLSTQTIVARANKENGEADSCTSGSQNFECGSQFTGSVCDDNKPVISHNNVNVECGTEDGADAKPTPAHPSKNVKLIYASQEQAIKASFGHEQKPQLVHEQHEIHFHQGQESAIATVAWMIIFGDGFHNFIDGVSIGAAFQQSILTGISISLAVMCEELPHELGDFAVLLNSGMTMKQALFYNFLSATTCYIGMVCGILLGEFTQDSTFIFALAAGMFLYISFVDMIPEMNETAIKATEKGIGDIIYVLFLQNLGMFLGVFSLFLLAYYQDSITLD